VNYIFLNVQKDTVKFIRIMEARDMFLVQMEPVKILNQVLSEYR